MRELKVGVLVLAALGALAAGILLIGEERNLFVRKTRYFVRFENVGGLAERNPVQLNGVTVGRVEEVVLPHEADEKLLVVWISIDRGYENRVRVDSVARIKTLGLLGDKYIFITSGSPDAAPVPPGGEITAAQATDVDELIASGESAVDNLVAISVSLRTILSRMEAGEGVLGELTSDSETGKAAKEKALRILSALETTAVRLENGEGTIGALLADNSLADQIQTTTDRLDRILSEIEEGDGLANTFISDPENAQKFRDFLTKLDTAADELTGFVAELRGGDGVLSMLLTDEEYGKELADDMKELMRNLNSVSGRLESGEGTLGALINDPALYQALDDIVVGVDESKMLRWLVRNRQKAGIEERYEEESGDGDGER